jgi:hypothetical protein
VSALTSFSRVASFTKGVTSPSLDPAYFQANLASSRGLDPDNYLQLVPIRSVVEVPTKRRWTSARPSFGSYW